MALSGVHVTFGYGIAASPYVQGGAVLPFNAMSSETMASPATSTKSAPSEVGVGGRPMISISASAAIFYVTGAAPDINNGPRRYYDPTFGREDIFVNAGDKIAWTTA